jgi:hypothetical protein
MREMFVFAMAMAVLALSSHDQQLPMWACTPLFDAHQIVSDAVGGAAARIVWTGVQRICGDF